MTPLEIVKEQAEDEMLWVQTTSITESYLQQELRRLHSAIEEEHQQLGAYRALLQAQKQ
jgi:hypothetical protein